MATIFAYPMMLPSPGVDVADPIVTEKGIAIPNPRDVLFGRGKAISHQHEGNIFYLNLVKKLKVQYVASLRDDKQAIANFVYKSIVGRSGRFLKKTGDMWFQVDEREAMIKVRAALREGAPKIEKILKKSTSERLDYASSCMNQSAKTQPRNITNSFGSSFTSEGMESNLVSEGNNSTASVPTVSSQETDFPVPDFAKDVEYLTGILNIALADPKSEELDVGVHRRPTFQDIEHNTNLMTLMDLEPTPLEKAIPLHEISDDSKKGNRRVSVRLSILSSSIMSGDDNQSKPSTHRNSLLSLSDFFDPKTLESEPALKDEMYDIPARRDDVVLQAFKQDIKENRRSIVIHKRSSLSEAVEMYFEDCENNAEMYSASDVDTLRKVDSPVRNTRRGSMTDECIISMVVEKMINDDELDKSTLDDDISAMSFCDHLEM